MRVPSKLLQTLLGIDDPDIDLRSIAMQLPAQEPLSLDALMGFLQDGAAASKLACSLLAGAVGLHARATLVWTDPAFDGQLAQAVRTSTCSELASTVYRQDEICCH